MNVRVGPQESWAPKNWYFWTVVLEKTLESSLDCKEIKPVSPKGNQSWIFTGRTDTEAPTLWPPDEERNHWKRPWCWERLRAGEGGDRGSITDSVDMSEQTLGDCEGQGSLVCYCSWSSLTAKSQTWLSNWTNIMEKQLRWYMILMLIFKFS